MNGPKQELTPVFSTPWFKVLATSAGCGQRPHYVIEAPDFVVVVALDPEGRLLLVRQYRHAAAALTLELPAGHVDAGDTAEQAARKELLEETGYEAETFELLGKLSPSTARFKNRLWCFFTADARPSARAAEHREAGMELVLYERDLKALLAEPEFHSTGSCSGLLLALARGKLKL